MSIIIKVISRKSNLARIQVEEVAKQLPDIKLEKIFVEAFGDLHHEISLLDNPPADLFTREIDEAILDRKADVAIHSAKDLPYPLANGLEIIALLPAANQSDSLVSKGHLTLNNLREGARVGTSSPVRRRELLAARPDLTIVSIRGTIEQRVAQVDDGFIDALVVATCALDRLGLSHLAAEELTFETHPLQGHLAIVAATGRDDLKTIFEPLDIRKKFGRVTLVGFGPGNPDLLTVAGLKALQSTDVICYDDLTNADFLRQFSAERIFVGKRKGDHSMEQYQINRLLLNLAKAGKKVVRLKGGDPMIFAHGGEEIRYLQENCVIVHAIPGISAGLAAASLSGTTLTHRDYSSSVAFVSGHQPDLKLPDADTVVIYMGAGHIRKIATKAIADGRKLDTPVLLIYKVSLPDQQEFFSTLADLSNTEQVFPTPLIIIVGAVSHLNRHAIEQQQTRILITGTHAEHYPQIGKVTHQPLIAIERIHPNSDLDKAIDQLHFYNWLIFTSRHTVQIFFDALKAKSLDARWLASVKIAAVGNVTSDALKLNGITPDLIPAEESSEGLLKLMITEDIAPSRVLIPRSAIGLPVLPQGLQAAGWEVTTLPVYQNVMPEILQPVSLDDIQQIVFSSPSCVTNFKKLYGDFPTGKKFIFRGKETEKRFKAICDEKIQRL